MPDRHSLIHASYLVLIKDNKVLLARRINTGYEDGNYSLIAGHVERSETFTECVIRESMEEGRIIIKAEDLRVVHVMQRNSKEKVANERLDVFFVAEKWSGEPMINEPHKCDYMGWFDMDHLPENIIPYIKHALEQIQRRNFYSEYGWH
ncbi:TPA: NUDIX hydrolase [Candidatus Falkowbacteria bacterium]|nr:NUDIX hydrolase [Candidatus Falkowbacteria bacterium]